MRTVEVAASKFMGADMVDRVEKTGDDELEIIEPPSPPPTNKKEGKHRHQHAERIAKLVVKYCQGPRIYCGLVTESRETRMGAKLSASEHQRTI